MYNLGSGWLNVCGYEFHANRVSTYLRRRAELRCINSNSDSQINFFSIRHHHKGFIDITIYLRNHNSFHIVYQPLSLFCTNIKCRIFMANTIGRIIKSQAPLQRRIFCNILSVLEVIYLRGFISYSYTLFDGKPFLKGSSFFRRTRVPYRYYLKEEKF